MKWGFGETNMFLQPGTALNTKPDLVSKNNQLAGVMGKLFVPSKIQGAFPALITRAGPGGDRETTLEVKPGVGNTDKIIFAVKP